ncbi:MAG: hypothetical protein IT432_04540 [Phycisphaerales bacterium]|nr:hypothetical protein [Phycisphaerales bacterium]
MCVPSIIRCAVLLVSVGCAASAVAQPTITVIGLAPGSSGGALLALSADGTAATGEAYTATGTAAYRWTRSGGIQNIGSFLGGNNGTGAGISADGSVIAGTQFTGGSRGYRWTSATGPVNIGILPGGPGGCVTAGISGDGSVIVGLGGSADGARAFRWTEGGGMQSLGTLPGGTRSEATAISTDASAVAGSSNTHGGERAFR